MILPDTSIWVAYLRVGAEGITAELNLALEHRQVLVCGPVVAELVAGTRPSDRATLLASLAGMPWADLDHHAWQSVGLLAAELRDSGQSLPLTDLQIAVAAHASGATLWTGDHHFKRLALHLDPLDLRLVD